MPVDHQTKAQGPTTRERMRKVLWSCGGTAFITCFTFVAAGSAQPAPTLSSATVVVRPSNLEAASVFQPFLDSMWRSSPTFNSQCRRLVAAERLKVVLRLEESQRHPSFYARTVLERRDGVLVAAHVFLSPTPTAVELIAHEVEHVLEQLDGVDLEAQAGSGNVWKRADGAFETRRATEMGRRVAREVKLRPGASQHLLATDPNTIARFLEIARPAPVSSEDKARVLHTLPPKARSPTSAPLGAGSWRL